MDQRIGIFDKLHSVKGMAMHRVPVCVVGGLTGNMAFTMTGPLDVLHMVIVRHQVVPQENGETYKDE